MLSYYVISLLEESPARVPNILDLFHSVYISFDDAYILKHVFLMLQLLCIHSNYTFSLVLKLLYQLALRVVLSLPC